MKPAWDQLGAEYDGHASVVVMDVDCTVETELCSDKGVSGYPTIKYYTADTGKEGEAYNGGRDFDSLKAHCEDKLAAKCFLDAQDGCTDKEKGYITKMSAKSAEDVTKQVTRLDGMKAGSMKPELKAWLNQRLAILKQIAAKEE